MIYEDNEEYNMLLQEVLIDGGLKNLVQLQWNKEFSRETIDLLFE